MTIPKRPIPPIYHELGGDEPLVFDDEGVLVPPATYPRVIRRLGDYAGEDRRAPGPSAFDARAEWSGVVYMTEAERKAIDALYPRSRRVDRVFGLIVWAFLTFALAYFMAHVLIAAGVGR
jgi:hypothetical protein